MSNGLHQYQAFITHKGFHDCHVMQSRSQTKRQTSSRKTSPSNLKSLSQWHAIQMRRIRQLRETKEFSCCTTVCRGVYSQPARTLTVLSTKTSGEVKHDMKMICTILEWGKSIPCVHIPTQRICPKPSPNWWRIQHSLKHPNFQSSFQYMLQTYSLAF